MKLKQITCVLFLFSLFFLTPDYSYGQFEKGHMIIGGNFGFQYYNNIVDESYQRYGNFNINPTLGYFISEKSMIGLSPNISLNTNQSSFNPESEYRWGLGASIFYRRFFKASDQFHFFIEPSIGYTERNNSDLVDDRFTVALAPGLVYVASEKIWLEAKFGGLRYESTNYGSRENPTANQYFSAGLFSSTYLGIYFIIK